MKQDIWKGKNGETTVRVAVVIALVITSVGGVLLNFSVYTRKAEAQTGLDMAITSVTPHQTIFYFQRGDDIQVIVDVTYKNNGTVDIYVNEDDPDPNVLKQLYYGYSLVHESRLGYYSNPGRLEEPTLVTPYMYTAPGGCWFQMLLEPGESFTQTLGNLYVYILEFDPDPLPGYYYVYPRVLLEDDNPGNNIPWWSSVPYAKIRFRLRGVGGIATPINKLELLAPYLGLTSTIVVAAVATAIYVKRVKRREEK
jgi:hypothetical protein